jgi:hypothetical protein
VDNDSIPLELAHIQPLYAGGETSEDNLTILCPNCHVQSDRQPREAEFAAFLVELLKANPSFVAVEQEPLLGDRERLRPDILVKRRISGHEVTLVIECKTAVALGITRIGSVAEQLTRYVTHIPQARPVLAVPATLSEGERSALARSHIELWDLAVLAEMFREHLPTGDGSFYGSLLARYLLKNKRPTREEQLIARLTACQSGKRDWMVYQKLIGEILEELFYPPLNKPIPELSDKPKVNRRDFVVPNYADSGFWAFLRDKYQADYVVVDAKNYSRRVGKSEVLQIANYLKPHGAGLFALICSRLGGDERGCEHTLREQWLVHQKLILVLSDEDLSAMLTAKSERRGPEEILAAKIESFRLSM